MPGLPSSSKQPSNGATAPKVSKMSQQFPPKPKWDISQIPDLTGMKVIVTGASAGIGKETARVLASKHAKVYLATRSKSKTEAAIAEIKASVPDAQLEFLELDLANLDSVRKAAENYASRERELHVLFNNGGVMAVPLNQMTSDGYDMQFGTNTLGHFHFTTLLLPILVSTARSPSNTSGTVRVVNTSSIGHELFTPPDALEDWNVLKESGEKRTKLGQYGLYGLSKWGNIVVAKEFQRRYGAQGIISTAVHPGAIRSELARNYGFTVRWLWSKLLADVSLGALTQLYAGTAPETASKGGEYFVPWARWAAAREDTDKVELREKLWSWMEEQVKGH